MVNIKFEGFDKYEKALKKLQRKTKNLKPFYDKAKFIMFKDVQDHFRKEQSPAGIKWKALKPATLKARRGGGGKILQDTGRLRQVTPFSSSTSAIIGTNLKYAKTHNKGDQRRGIPRREFMWLSNRAGKQILELMEKHLTQCHFQTQT